MKKSLLAWAIALTCLLSLTACGKETSSEPLPDESADAATETVEETETVVEEEAPAEEEIVEEESVEEALVDEEEFVEEDEGTYIEDEGSDLTLYANGGIFWSSGDEPYDFDLTASYMDLGVTFGDVVNEISSIEKEDAEFAGWTVYAVEDGEWVQEEVTDLSEEQACVPCGGYGYYLMNVYEIVSENETTENLLTYVNDGRDYYAMVNWQ